MSKIVAADVPKIKVAVLGAGAFGTAMAVVASRNNHDVVILCRRQEQADSINQSHKNIKVFQDVVLPSNITATCVAEEALKDTGLIIHAIPVQSSLSYLSAIKDIVPEGVPVMSTSKGIHVETQMLMCGVLEAALRKGQPTAFLSGPSFAKEMIAGYPTTVVIGCEDHNQAVSIAETLSNNFFRGYTTEDVIGLELGGALKNPLAIGAGIIEGLGYGSNTLAGFITRGCAEMKKLAICMGAKSETLNGLSGIGDLMLTAYGGLSRNRTVGVRLGKGEKLEEILVSLGQVAEGVPTAGVVVKLADEHGLELPIFRTIEAFITGKVSPEEGLKMVMERPLKREIH